MRLPTFDKWDVPLSVLAACLAGVLALLVGASVVIAGVSAVIGYWCGRFLYIAGYSRGFSEGYRTSDLEWSKREDANGTH